VPTPRVVSGVEHFNWLQRSRQKPVSAIGPRALDGLLRFQHYELSSGQLGTQALILPEVGSPLSAHVQKCNHLDIISLLPNVSLSGVQGSIGDATTRKSSRSPAHARPRTKRVRRGRILSAAQRGERVNELERASKTP
jgi:hypothetical protein